LAASAAWPAFCAQGDARLQAAVERRIIVTENKTIFTLFCLLNLGGYDEENNPAGMHPVRRRVRQQLSQDVPPALTKRIRDFYGLHKDRSGYVLERFFCDQLGEYEKSGQDLSAYYPVMLKRLNPAQELSRWKQETRAGDCFPRYSDAPGQYRGL
jgi:hypothetical protein